MLDKYLNTVPETVESEQTSQQLLVSLEVKLTADYKETLQIFTNDNITEVVAKFSKCHKLSNLK